LQSINKDGIMNESDKENTKQYFIIGNFNVLILKNISIFYCILLKMTNFSYKSQKDIL